MHSSQISFNTRILVLLAVALLGIQMANYLFVRLQDGVLPMGRFIFGLTVYAALAVAYWKNQWQRRWRLNPWVVLYVGYITLSFLYGYKRYGTITASVFDYWIFLYLPAIVLIPPYAFNVHVFDRIMAFGVLISLPAMALIVAVKSDSLYDRDIFTFYVSPLSSLGAGAGYLVLKHARRVNVFTLIGLAGVLGNAMLYGVVGAFRGQMLLSILLLVLYLFIQLRTIHISFGWKSLSFIVLAISLVGAALLVSTKFQEQLLFLTERFVSIFDAYDKTGDIIESDARLGEFMYFWDLNPSWKLISGHGVGALWYDFYGMFGAEIGGTYAGARTMLHMNWGHILFKIGVIGFGLMLCMLVRNYRQHRVFLKANRAWWMFLIWYLAFTTYYGDKALGLGSMVSVLVLVHPWLMQTGEEEPHAMKRRALKSPHRAPQRRV